MEHISIILGLSKGGLRRIDPMGKDQGASVRRKGGAEEAPLKCGVSELLPLPEGAGFLCPAEGCCFQWDRVVFFEGGEVRAGFQQNRFR